MSRVREAARPIAQDCNPRRREVAAQRSEDTMNTQSSAETRQHEKYDRLIARCEGLPPIPTAVAHPCDDISLSGAIDAAKPGSFSRFS